MQSKRHTRKQEIIQQASGSGVNLETLEEVVLLSVEIAREGREGRKVGTMFVVSDSDAVLERSRCLILDPLMYHADDAKHIGDPDMRETVKELAQLDGAFVVSNEGVVRSACRYLNASSEGVRVPLGLGGRHIAAASISRETSAVAVVVSESSVVRIFKGGTMVTEIIPELWLLNEEWVRVSDSTPRGTVELARGDGDDVEART